MEDYIAEALADLQRADIYSRDAKALYCCVIAARIGILLARPDLRHKRDELTCSRVSRLLDEEGRLRPEADPSALEMA